MDPRAEALEYIDWEKKKSDEAKFIALINIPEMGLWSEVKRNRWHCAVITLVRIEEEMKATDLDYQLLCKHMNLVGQWIKTWDHLQELEYLLEEGTNGKGS